MSKEFPLYFGALKDSMALQLANIWVISVTCEISKFCTPDIVESISQLANIIPISTTLLVSKSLTSILLIFDKPLNIEFKWVALGVVNERILR